MPDAVHDYCQLYAKTATGAGDALGIGGERVRYANGVGINRNGANLSFKARCWVQDSTTGATATVVVQESDDNATWNTLATLSYSLTGTIQAHARLFSTKKAFIRFNITALAGGSAPTVYGYFTVPTGT